MLSSNSDLSLIKEMFYSINEKLAYVIPRITAIEQRLDKLDSLDSLSEIKSSTSDILTEVQGYSQSLLSSSKSSDTMSQVSDQSDVGSLHNMTDDPNDKAQYGLVMSDSDMTELASRAGKITGCEVDNFNYSQEQLEPSLFSKKLEFVLIQDSGKMLEQYNELTNTTVEEITAHVQQFVKLTSNILQLQPDTKVFFGSLPPRYDGRLRSDLVRVFNGLLLTETVLEDRISVLNQSQLSCRNEKKKVERYKQNLVTLTRYGQKLRDKNLIKQIVETVPHLSTVRKDEDGKHQYRQDYARPGTKQNLKEMLADFLHRL